MPQMRIPVVAVDTTEFFTDLTLSKSAWSQMRVWALKGHAELWVPEVVIQEAMRHYRGHLDDHLRKLSDADNALHELAWDRDSQSSVERRHDEVAALQSGYGRWLRARLDRVGAVILPLPRMSHKEILGRMLREERPFRAKGGGGKKGSDGYRDMLIWASIAEHGAEHLGPEDTLYFITGNHSDFCEDQKTDTVARALLTDLTGQPPQDKQVYAMGFQSLDGKIPAVQRLDRLADLAEILPKSAQDAAELTFQDRLATDGHLRTRLQQAVKDACDELAGREIDDVDRVEPYGAGLDFDELHLPLDDPRLAAIDVHPDTVRAAVYGTDPDAEPVQLLATVTAEAEAHVEGFLHVSDHDEDSDFSVSLVNDYTYEAEGTRPVILHFNARFAPDHENTIELDLDKATPLGN